MIVREHRVVDGVGIIVAIYRPSKSRSNSTTTLARRTGWILELEGQHVTKLLFPLRFERNTLIVPFETHAGVAQSGGGASLRN